MSTSEQPAMSEPLSANATVSLRDPERVWDVAHLMETPRLSPFQEPFRGEVTPIFIEGEPFKGRGTWCFAFYGVPDWATPERPAPGIVLAHGGAGTAYPEWVRMWVRRGYAAICVDTCGTLPVQLPGKEWLPNPDGGPHGWGRVEAADEPERDQWTYHAVAALMRSHSFLRSLPGVDADAIGCTGVSWGGFLACILAAADHRLKFSVPVYGCGFNQEPGGLTAGHPLSETWAALWDASSFLPFVRCPMLWVDGTNDHAFSLDRVRRSAALAPVPHAFSTHLRMNHGHGAAGEGPREILAFADHFLRGGADIVRVGECRVEDGLVKAAITPNGRNIVRAELLYTLDGESTPWTDRLWHFAEANLEKDLSAVSAPLPHGAEEMVLNVITYDGLVFSTPHWTVRSQGHLPSPPRGTI